MKGAERIEAIRAALVDKMSLPINKQYENLRTCPELRNIPDDKFPQSVVVIPDGNRRYANAHHTSTEAGHQAGADKVVDLLNAFADTPVKSVTIWGFSSDNWNRDPKEIDAIMKIMDRTAKTVLPDLMKRNGKLIHLGRTDRIPLFLLHTIKDAECKTEKNTGQVVGLAIDFGGEDQEERILEQGRHNMVLKRSELRDGKGLIKPADLLIRTGEEPDGLIHTSDIGWLNGKPTVIKTYTKSFPELTRKDVAHAIHAFALRQRRQGK